MSKIAIRLDVFELHVNADQRPALVSHQMPRSASRQA
jgi:hypothetical protein